MGRSACSACSLSFEGTRALCASRGERPGFWGCSWADVNRVPEKVQSTQCYERLLGHSLSYPRPRLSHSHPNRYTHAHLHPLFFHARTCLFSSLPPHNLCPPLCLSPHAASRLNNMRYNLEASSRTILQLKSEAQLKDARIASLLAELRERDAALASLQSQLRVANSSINNWPHPAAAAEDGGGGGGGGGDDDGGVESRTSPVPVICQAVYSPRKVSQQPEGTSSSSSASLPTKRGSSSNSGGFQPAAAESGGNFQGWRKSAGSGKWQASTPHVVSLSPPARSPIHGPMTGTPSKFDQSPSQPLFSPKLSPVAGGSGMEGIGLSSPVVQVIFPTSFRPRKYRFLTRFSLSHNCRDSHGEVCLPKGFFRRRGIRR